VLVCERQLRQERIPSVDLDDGDACSCSLRGRLVHNRTTKNDVLLVMSCGDKLSTHEATADCAGGLQCWTHARAGVDVVDLSLSLSPLPCCCCDRTTPIDSLDASVSSVHNPSSTGMAKTGGDVSADLSFSNH